MAMQLTAVFTVAGSNPGQVNLASADQGSNHQPKTLCRLGYHSTSSGLIAICFPIAWSLLSENF